MKFTLSSTTGVPIWMQIVNQVKNAIASGELRPYDALPTIHDLAIELTVNPNTVARAYRELESAGLVKKKRAVGTFVSEACRSSNRADADAAFDALVDALLAEARIRNIEPEDLVRRIKQRNRRDSSSHKQQTHD